MTIQPIQIASVDNKHLNKNKSNQSVSFGGGLANAVVPLMDAIDRGGFAASFILQDFLGMAAPRVGTGMFRNYDKTGELNWDFAKKEAVREILSGPSVFIIPLLMMKGIKKVSGSSNNIPINFINGFSNEFADFAQNNQELIKNSPKEAKETFYKQIFKNALENSTNGELKGEKLEQEAERFAKNLIKAEQAPSKSFWKNLTGKKVANSAQDLKQDILNDFIKLRKQYLGYSEDTVSVVYKSSDSKSIGTSLKSFIGHMNDYTEDAIKHVEKELNKTPELEEFVLNKTPELDVKEFVKNFSRRRSGTRFLSNIAMFGGVAAFFTIIPKLYNKATKGTDPGLNGLVSENSQPANNKQNKQVAFTGKMNIAQKGSAKLGDFVSGFSDRFKNIFEFSGASMSVESMLGLLFGFCLTPRLINAQSNTDRKEILFRDVTSFFAILFGAKTLTKIFSDLFANRSGLALNIKPENHNESIFKKISHYISPSGGVQVLDSDRIISTYSDVASSKNGISDLFTFVDKHGGNVGKMLSIDKEIKEAATTILGEAPNRNMKTKDIINKFKKAEGSEAYKKIIDILGKADNTLVEKAKTYNSAFGFASLLLVPALMIWISKHCENMTKKRIAEENRLKAEAQVQTNQPQYSNILKDNHPTMAGFLNK